jgi:hypothetical protein
MKIEPKNKETKFAIQNSFDTNLVARKRRGQDFHPFSPPHHPPQAINLFSRTRCVSYNISSCILVEPEGKEHRINIYIRISLYRIILYVVAILRNLDSMLRD